jgi:hypothetical protein
MGRAGGALGTAFSVIRVRERPKKERFNANLRVPEAAQMACAVFALKEAGFRHQSGPDFAP